MEIALRNALVRKVQKQLDCARAAALHNAQLCKSSGVAIAHWASAQEITCCQVPAKIFRAIIKEIPLFIKKIQCFWFFGGRVNFVLKFFFFQFTVLITFEENN